ncbi:MAG: methionine adenosyltransferase domain-containing protein [Burkholderiales bacterium]
MTGELTILPCIPPAIRDPRFRSFVNPAGAFVTGGPKGDTGLTGRKIVVDTYGSACAHGGGAFSGKDATKVDRSGAYMARYLAKHVVAAGIAPRCTIQIAYAIGVPEPVAIDIDAHGCEGVDEDALARALTRVFDLTPAGIICELQLDRPIFSATSVYAHFGRTGPAFTWERTPHIAELVREYARLARTSCPAGAHA